MNKKDLPLSFKKSTELNNKKLVSNTNLIPVNPYAVYTGSQEVEIFPDMNVFNEEFPDVDEYDFFKVTIK